MDDIAEMFEAFSNYERLEGVLASAYKRTQTAMSASERTALWRIQNPKKYRALRKRCAKNWKARNPDKVRLSKQRKVDKNRAKYRAMWRRNKAASRARKST